VPVEDTPVSLVIDHAQPRLGRKRLQTTITGGVRGGGGDYADQRQGFVGGTVFVDPVTFRAILTPAAFHPDWRSEGSGTFVRLRKSDYVDRSGDPLGTDWREDTVLHDEDYYLLSQSAAPPEVYTAATWEQNRGFFVSFFQYTTGTDEREVFQCGWGELGELDSSSLSYRVYSSGRAEVWRYGELIGEGSTAGTKNERGPSARGQDLGPRFIGLLILPWCTRDVLMLSTAGGGFNQTLPDIPEDAAPEEAIITREGDRFWWYTPAGTAKVQAAPARFIEEGHLIGIRSRFMRPPRLGAVADLTLYSDLVTTPGYNEAEGRLVRWDDIDAGFVADGEERQARIRVDLASEGVGTPVIHAATAVFPSEIVETDASEAVENALDYCMALSVDVQDSAPSAKVELSLRSPGELPAAGLNETEMRPVEMSIGEFIVFDGMASAPKFVDAIEDEVRRVSLELRDFTRQMEELDYADTVPLDGLEVGEAHRRIARDAGIPEHRLAIGAGAYRVPLVGSQAKGDWNTAIQPADNALEWQMRLWETYSGRAFFGVVPVAGGGPQLQLILEGDLETEPDIDLYDDDDQAYQALLDEGHSPSEAARLRFSRVMRTFESHPVPCLANELWVTGMDPRTRRPIVTTRNDEQSQDASLAPSLRPRNWVGGFRAFGLVDPTLTTEEALERVADTMAPRLFKAPIVCQWESELLLRPASTEVIWKGRVVRLWRRGESTDWRIQAFSAQHVKEPAEGDLWRWRPARYIATQIEEDDGIGESANYELGGAGLGVAGVLARRKVAAQARRKVRDRAEFLTWAMPIRVS